MKKESHQNPKSLVRASGRILFPLNEVGEVRVGAGARVGRSPAGVPLTHASPVSISRWSCRCVHSRCEPVPRIL